MLYPSRERSCKTAVTLLLAALVLNALILARQALAAEANPASQVVMETSLGTITIELEDRLAPTSVDNFLGYVDKGFYDGTIFHRVIDGFMIQGGGFTTEYQRKQTEAPIQNEANNGLKNRKYSLAMARTSAPHSATAQFFINTVDNDYLDYKAATARGWGYAVFGRVIDGFDVVDQISSSPTGARGPFGRDAPLQEIVIKSATRVVADSADSAGEDASGSDTAASATGTTSTSN